MKIKKKKLLWERLLKPNLFQRLYKRIRSLFYVDQWVLLRGSNVSFESPSWSDFSFILPPIDRDWADPFIWNSEGQAYIFYEEKPYSTGRGHISCLTFDQQMNIVSNQIVLQRPYHLSYPFLFQYNEQIFMLPETKENRAVELYKCIHFPDRWSFEKTLIYDIDAVDATLVQANGKWWMFVNVADENDNSWNTLHLFFADNPLSDEWTSHPLNPVVNDVSSARPAGRIFTHNDNLIRPSQNCSPHYGYALNFNHIISLSDMDFAESRLLSFTPPSKGNPFAIHTWNRDTETGINMIDAKIRRPRFWPYKIPSEISTR